MIHFSHIHNTGSECSCIRLKSSSSRGSLCPLLPHRAAKQSNTEGHPERTGIFLLLFSNGTHTLALQSYPSAARSSSQDKLHIQAAQVHAAVLRRAC